MVNHVFVDTAAWLALVNTDDNLHRQAEHVMHGLRRQNVRLLTTEFVLVEVADALARPPYRSRVVVFIEGLRSSPRLQIVPASQTLLTEAWALYRQRPDKDWSLTDCTSFVVMSRERIVQAFTSDHHFEQAGFQRLLSPP